jgi:hypothetical protein
MQAAADFISGQNEFTTRSDLCRIVTHVAAKGPVGGQTPVSSMSGHLRFCFAAFGLLASLSPSPASSKPVADSFNVAPQPSAGPASAERECLPRPGKSTTARQHWVYRSDGHRKCWFLIAQGIATVKKRVHQHPAKDRDADARAEWLRSASAEASQPTPPVSEHEVIDAASVIATGPAPLAPSASPVDRATVQLTPDHYTPIQVDRDTLLAAAPAAPDAFAASVVASAPVAEAGDDWRGWSANWLGMLLMALGMLSVLSSSRFLRRAVPVGQLK